MARDLQELEDFLWTEFDAAKSRHESYKSDCDFNRSNETHAGNFAIENRKALAAMAEAIVAVRREKRVEKFSEDQQRIQDEVENGTRRDVAVGKPIKLAS